MPVEKQIPLHRTPEFAEARTECHRLASLRIYQPQQIALMVAAQFYNCVYHVKGTVWMCRVNGFTKDLPDFEAYPLLSGGPRLVQAQTTGKGDTNVKVEVKHKRQPQFSAV